MIRLHPTGGKLRGAPAADRHAAAMRVSKYASVAGLPVGVLAVGLLAAGLLAAGCGTVPAPGPGSGSAQPGSAAVHDIKPGRTLAGNRELASQQAAWLLSRVPVPGGAVRLRSVPASLSSPATGTPGVATLVDEVRAWRIEMPFAQLAAWLGQHRPAGLPPEGSMSATDRGQLTEVGYGYRGHASPAWQSAELGIGVAPAGPKASVMRADGQVIYLDPRPVPDNAKGPRLRVTIAGGCPRTDTGVVGVRNSGTGLRRRLLPSGSPTAGLVCRYAATSGPQSLLRAATRLDAAAAARLARSMARLPLSHTDGATYHCPPGENATEVIALAYPHRSDVDLWEQSYGCPPYVANGFIQAASSG